MTFDLCNSLKPNSPGGRLWQSVQETLGFQKMIVQKIPPGGGGLLVAQGLLIKLQKRAAWIILDTKLMTPSADMFK